MNNENGCKTIIQVMDSLGTNRGGLTKAVFERLAVFSESAHVVLATVAYQPDIRLVFERLQNEGTIPANVELRSFHEDGRNLQIGGTKTSLSNEQWGADPNVDRVPDGKFIDRYYSAGRFLGLVAKDSANNVKYVDVHDDDNPWVLKHRERAWRGNISVREYPDSANNIRYRIFFTQDGVPYMSTWVTPNRYEYRTTYWSQRSPTTLRDVRVANSIWLNELIDEFENSTVYFDEPRTSFAASIANVRAKTVATIHTTHRTSAHGTELKSWTEHYIKNMANIDELIVLTEAQKSQIVDDFNAEPDKVLVIPHGIPSLRSHQGIHDYDPNLLVIVSRLAREKRIDQAIVAFEQVVGAHSYAKLDIYGSGPEQTHLEKIIEDRGLTERVNLKGHTSSPLDVFANAAASILTSEFEGFGLVIVESFSQGTPVIAYRAPYGSEELVDNDCGALVNDGDLQALAAAMLQTVEDRDLITKKREQAWTKASNFSTEVWKSNWQSTVG